MKERILRVWANPYAHVDHKGRAAGAVRRTDFDDDGHVMATPNFEFVGAQMIVDVLKTETRGTGGRRYTNVTKQDTHFEFDDEPQMIWNSSIDPRAVVDFRHYAEAIRHGALIPADEATAKFFGMPFVGRDDAIAAAKKKALDGLKEHGIEDDDMPSLEYAPLGARAAKLKADAERKRRVAAGEPPQPATEKADAQPPTPTSDDKRNATPPSASTATKPGLVSLAEPQPPKTSAPEVSK